MKAPDKIYLQTCGNCEFYNSCHKECEVCEFKNLAEVTWSEDRVFETDREYISKDAILDILRKEHERAKSEPISGISNGELFLASHLIDKIGML